MSDGIKVDDMVTVYGWGDDPCRVVAVNWNGDVVVEHPSGDTDTMPAGWVSPIEPSTDRGQA